MLEQKGFSLDPLKAESQTTLKKLARKGHEWLARWQKRHGSYTQTFQNGSRIHAGAAVGEVRRNSFILKQGSWFFGFRWRFFLLKNPTRVGPFLDPPGGLVSGSFKTK